TNESIPLLDNSANRRNLPSGPQFKLDLQFFAASKIKKAKKPTNAIRITPQIRQQRLRELEAELKETKENLELAAQVGQGLIEINGNLNREIERLNKNFY
ncbi:21192_t:CDS:1, partial [Racocetra persica]